MAYVLPRRDHATGGQGVVPGKWKLSAGEEIKLALITSNRVFKQNLTFTGRYQNIVSGFKRRRLLLKYLSR
jgi:hypothetical protein